MCDREQHSWFVCGVCCFRPLQLSFFVFLCVCVCHFLFFLLHVLFFVVCVVVFVCVYVRFCVCVSYIVCLFAFLSPRQCLGEALGLAGPPRGNASGRLWARKRASSRQCLREALGLEGGLPEAMPRGGSGLGGASPRQCLGEALGRAGPPRGNASGRLGAGRGLPELSFGILV